MTVLLLKHAFIWRYLADASYFCKFVEPESSLRKSPWVLKYKQTRKKRNEARRNRSNIKKYTFFCVMVSIDVLNTSEKILSFSLISTIKNIWKSADLFWATKTTNLDEKKQIISGLLFFFQPWEFFRWPFNFGYFWQIKVIVL